MAAIELEHAIGYGGTLPSSLVCHPNGRDLVYVAGGCVVVANISDPHGQQFLSGHTSDITAFDVSPTGRLIATGQKGEDSDVLVWDFATRKVVFRLQEHDNGVSCVHFSHDERLLVTVGTVDRRMFIWDMKTGNIVARCTQDPAPTNIVRFVGMVQDVKRRDTECYQLVAAGAQQLRVYSLNPYTGALTGERIGSAGHVREYTALCGAIDTQLLYAGSTSGDITVVALRGRQLAGTAPACSGGVRALVRLGPALAVGGGDGTVRLFGGDGVRLVEQRRVQVDAAVTSLHALDAETLLIGTAVGSMFTARLSDALQPRRLSEAHAGPVLAVAFPVDMNDRFATASADGVVRFWDISHYVVVSRGAVRGGGHPTCVGFAGPCMVCGCSDGVVRAFDMDNGTPLWEIRDAHRGGVTALAVSHNERFIVTGGEAGDVRVWELRTRELVSHFKEHTARVVALEVFQDDMHVVSASKDRAMLVWDLKAEKRMAAYQSRTGAFNGLALFRDQTHVVSVGTDRRVSLWDLRVREVAGAVPVSQGEPTAVALAHSNAHYAVGCSTGHVGLWDARSHAPVASGGSGAGQGHTRDVAALQFSPDDKQLVSAGLDGNCFVWNVYGGAAV